MNVNNDTHRVGSAALGAVEGVDTGASGSYCFDAFESRGQTYMGTLPNPQTCGGKEGLLSGDMTLNSMPKSVDFLAGGQALVFAGEAITTTITYTYDPLYRLTASDYDDGSYFYYTHDSVGSRLTETTKLGEIDYLYDEANRLTHVDEITYTWDANGNLLNDGVNDYAFDRANRLISISNQQSTISNAYNGLADRLQQTVGVTTTTYTLDLAAGLTQVLSDGSSTYLYGLGRIGEQQPGGRLYHLGDALGSVRQLVYEAGEVSLARNYEPYGGTLSTIGDGSSVYQFTGEMRDTGGLTYLRARYLDTRTGRFTQIDPSRIEKNLFLYANANPVNYTDPTGLFSPEQIASSMGYASFEAMAMSLSTISDLPFLEFSRYEKWGFFSALLDAKEWDSINVGSPIIITPYPYIQYRGGESLWVRNCEEIMVGSRTLQDYFDHVLIQPTIRELPAEFWRETSPKYYQLSGPKTVSKRYVDGAETSDLPDFHSVDVSLWTGLIGGGPMNEEISGVVDRFGNTYLLGGASFGVPGGGARYSEGYVCTPYANCIVGLQADPIDFTSDKNIRDAIEGPCVGVGIIVDGGGTIIRCSSDSGAVIFSFGVTLSIGVSGTAGLPIGNDSRMGWNWAIEDRLNGINYVNLLIQSKRN